MMKTLRFAICIVCFSAVALTFTNCSKEPDGDDLYTFTGKTIFDFLSESADTADISDFIYILTRAKQDRVLSAYGQYTCFVPSNEGVAYYVDSLYNDTCAHTPHNGMTEPTVEGLTDELCKEIAYYHMMKGLFSTLKLSGEGKSVNTMLNRPVNCEVDTAGRTTLNAVSHILSADNILTNGIVHLVDRVIPRSTRLIFDDMERASDLSIFAEAMRRTGLDKEIAETDRGVTYNMGNSNKTNDGILLYYPTECLIGYTVFAETNEVFRKAGINNIDDLIEKCKEWYGNAREWYSYLSEKNIEVSTGDDYENTFNVLNMFVRYHILKGAMAVTQLVYERDLTNANWNYAFGGEPYDYFETMLPHTMMKIWQPLYHNTGSSSNIWINRCIANNTLTNQIGTMGTSDMHPIIREGVQIVHSLSQSITSYNGYVHRIKDILLYDQMVPQGVLNERLRLDVMTMLPEMSSNNIRGTSGDVIAQLNPYSTNGSYIAYPLDYFENIKCYNNTTHLLSCTMGPWRCWESDQIQGWGQYDFAIRIPPVPTGVYEMRIDFPSVSYGGMMQFYIGTSSSPGSMLAAGIPFDIRKQGTEYGYTNSEEEDDWGIESDRNMRNNGYMRAPCSFSRGTLNTTIAPVTDPSLITGNTNCRTESGTGTTPTMVRRIIVKQQFKQSEAYWIRIKSLINDDPTLKWFIDFIEMVPTSVCDNQNYLEDWY